MELLVYALFLLLEPRPPEHPNSRCWHLLRITLAGNKGLLCIEIFIIDISIGFIRMARFLFEKY